LPWLHFGTKEWLQISLCQVEAYDLQPTLSSQICIVVLTTMRRSWFLVLSFAMKKKLHGVSYVGPSYFSRKWYASKKFNNNNIDSHAAQLILFFHLRSLRSYFANRAFCKEGMTTSVLTPGKGYGVRATNCLNKLYNNFLLKEKGNCRVCGVV